MTPDRALADQVERSEPQETDEGRGEHDVDAVDGRVPRARPLRPRLHHRRHRVEEEPDRPRQLVRLPALEPLPHEQADVHEPDEPRRGRPPPARPERVRHLRLLRGTVPGAFPSLAAQRLHQHVGRARTLARLEVRRDVGLDDALVRVGEHRGRRPRQPLRLLGHLLLLGVVRTEHRVGVSHLARKPGGVDLPRLGEQRALRVDVGHERRHVRLRHSCRHGLEQRACFGEQRIRLGRQLRRALDPFFGVLVERGDSILCKLLCPHDRRPRLCRRGKRASDPRVRLKDGAGALEHLQPRGDRLVERIGERHVPLREPRPRPTHRVLRAAQGVLCGVDLLERLCGGLRRRGRDLASHRLIDREHRGLRLRDEPGGVRELPASQVRGVRASIHDGARCRQHRDEEGRKRPASALRAHIIGTSHAASSGPSCSGRRISILGTSEEAGSRWSAPPCASAAKRAMWNPTPASVSTRSGDASRCRERSRSRAPTATGGSSATITDLPSTRTETRIAPSCPAARTMHRKSPSSACAAQSRSTSTTPPPSTSIGETTSAPCSAFMRAAASATISLTSHASTMSPRALSSPERTARSLSKRSMS
ncbi:hypothetical protein emb_1d0681 [Coriobacteriaceae bacterium EMTCatB1]|nr:hypothetical protein emb_1d0681 [Coriobacteriaceae bacterium EMTCatB1]